MHYAALGEALPRLTWGFSLRAAGSEAGGQAGAVRPRGSLRGKESRRTEPLGVLLAHSITQGWLPLTPPPLPPPATRCFGPFPPPRMACGEGLSLPRHPHGLGWGPTEASLQSL